jgi:hypothetical protein
MILYGSVAVRGKKTLIDTSQLAKRAAVGVDVITTGGRNDFLGSDVV